MVKARIVTGLFLSLTTVPAAAIDPAFERVVEAARASAVIADDIIETARSGCRTALCFAEALAAEQPDRIRLEPVDHPDTDSIRLGNNPPLGER